MRQQISSTANPRIKELARLQADNTRRRKLGLVVVEGLREISLAVKCGFLPVSLYISPEIMNSPQPFEIIDAFGENRIVEVSREVFARIAYREERDGLVAVFTAPSLEPESLRLKDQPLVVVIESVEKPGNLGAILRTADAAGAGAVIVCDPLADVFNPNTIRASLGAVFTVPIAVSTAGFVREWLIQNSFRIYPAALCPSAISYTMVDYHGPVALVMGTEADGLSAGWLLPPARPVIIPMQGMVDSLNVSAAAAILIFEAIRQRNANP